MKIMPTSRDDMVIPRYIAAGWNQLRRLDLHLILALILLAIHLIYAYMAFNVGNLWLGLFIELDKETNPEAQFAITSQVLMLITAGAISLAGLSSALYTILRLSSAARISSGMRNSMLALHYVLLAAAMISINEIRAYTGELMASAWKQAFPFSLVLVLISAIGLVFPLHLQPKAKWYHILYQYFPLIHQACLLWMFALYYFSTIGNIVDVIK